MSKAFIVSNLGNLVIDIQKAATSPGTPLDVYTKKTKTQGWDNQLWEWVASGNLGWYALQNPTSGLVIDVRGAGNTAGTLLDAYTIGTTAKGVPNQPNQLWAFIPSMVTGYYFISSNLGNHLVIDVQKESTQPGTLLDVYTQRTMSPRWDNQLWTFVDEDGNSVTPPSPPPPPPPPIK
jgi:hypothetical protein